MLLADFIGESNILDGCMHQDFLVEFLGTKVPCVDKGFAPKEKSGRGYPARGH